MAPLGKGTQPLKHQNAHSHWRGLGFILGALLRCFFSGARVPRQDPLPPCCGQGSARGRWLSPSRSGLSGARRQHLLAKPVRGACGSALGSGNPTLETRLLDALRFLPCVYGAPDLNLCVWEFGSGPCTPSSGLLAWTLRPSSGLCSSGNGHHHPRYPSVVAALRDSHRGENSPPSQKFLMSWLAPGLCSLSLPRSRGLGEETENRGWPGASSKELWSDLKMSGCFLPKTVLQEAHLSTVIFCSTARPLQW